MSDDVLEPTEKQMAFLRRMMDRCYTGDRAHLVDPFMQTITTRQAASEAIQRMIDAGWGDLRPDKAAKDKPKGKVEKASPRQVDYAERLVDAAWHDSDMGQGFNPPTRAGLEKMSKWEISKLINELKAESGL
jgi:hypothetical protein